MIVKKYQLCLSFTNIYSYYDTDHTCHSGFWLSCCYETAWYEFDSIKNTLSFSSTFHFYLYYLDFINFPTLNSYRYKKKQLFRDIFDSWDISKYRTILWNITFLDYVNKSHYTFFEDLTRYVNLFYCSL